MIADGGASGLKYEYDEENRLTRVRIAANDTVLMEIGYDAVGRRVETVDYWDAQAGPLDPPRHTRHVYEGLQAVEEYECGTGVPACGSGWSLAREFFWGGRFPEPITMVDHTAAGLLPANQPEVLHYLHDVLGSVIGLTNSAGTLVERYSYDPYGKTLVERRDPLTGTFELNGADGNFPTWSAFGNPFMWTAQRYDATVGLYHFKYRTYNPIWGRWNQQDPLGYVDGVNLYEYVRSNPISILDVLGLSWILGLHSDPGYSGGQDPKDGHAWITLTDTTSGTTTTYGLWPDFHPEIQRQGLSNGLGSDVRTNFSGDTNRPPGTHVEWEITDEQAKALKDYVKNIQWWTGGNNCSRFAAKCVETVIGIRVQAYDGRILYFRTPAALARWIKKEQERREKEGQKKKADEEKKKNDDKDKEKEKDDKQQPPSDNKGCSEKSGNSSSKNSLQGA
ncbi:MAG: RHS repeat-associated core domain-containing protein [Phycisphaerae bacterium]|nr:RHS repeat-associated core domain-containing protein [Phycisphaerae bacterium]MCK6499930.1 RHS repeat-associated core domain-containing protein [Nitrospira sp.]